MDGGGRLAQSLNADRAFATAPGPALRSRFAARGVPNRRARRGASAYASRSGRRRAVDRWFDRSGGSSFRCACRAGRARRVDRHHRRRARAMAPCAAAISDVMVEASKRYPRHGGQCGRLRYRHGGAVGQRHLNREEILATAGVTGRASLLFFDVADARARLKTNPWIARSHGPEAAARPPADLRSPSAKPFALVAEGGPRSGSSPATAPCSSPMWRNPMSSLPLVVGGGAELRAKEFLALLDRYPGAARQCAGLGAGRRAALEPAAAERHRRAAAGIRCRASTRPARRARARQAKLSSRDIAVDRSRLSDRVTVQLSDTAAQARDEAAKKKQKTQGQQRMSPLNHGLTPKMKPVAAQAHRADCRGRRRHQQDRVPDRTTQAAAAPGSAAPAQPCDRGDRLQPHRIARHEGRHRGRSHRCRGSGAAMRSISPSAAPNARSSRSSSRCRRADCQRAADR